MPHVEPPAPVWVHLRQAYLENAAHNLLLVGKLLELNALLAQHAVPALFYKGPLMAETTYGHIGARQCSDLDLLIAPGDQKRLHAVLLAEGFRVGNALGWETDFLSPDGALNLDVHTAVTPKAFPCPIDFRDLWARRATVTLSSHDVVQPAVEDLLLILCVQAAKDRWENRLILSKVCDIAAVLQLAQGFNWGRLQEHVEALAAQRVVWYGVTLATELLRVPLPEAWPGFGVVASGLRNAVGRTRGRLVGDRPPVLVDVAERLWFHFRIQANWRNKLAQLHLLRMKLDDQFRRWEVR